jgi:hypothetical protein
MQHTWREKRIACRKLMGKPVGMRSLGRSRYRSEDNIKMDHREMGVRWCGMDLSGSG